jgi:hypothetical protein
MENVKMSFLVVGSLAFNTTIKIKPICLHWFYLITAICFGPYCDAYDPARQRLDKPVPEVTLSRTEGRLKAGIMTSE